jgi:quinol monooxygenase YgiN
MAANAFCFFWLEATPSNLRAVIKTREGVAMRILRRILQATIILSCLLFGVLQIATAYADDDERGRTAGAVYNVAHFDVIPITLGGVDFLQEGYSFLFAYRNASHGDAGLDSFRVLNSVAPETNHSEIVEVWSSYDAYKNHLAQRHTIDFRFNVQGNPALAGGICCVGSPIDDRQYSLVESFNTPWPAAPITSVGPSGSLYVITYVEFLQNGNVRAGKDALVDYGAATSRINGGHVQSFSILQQLDRPNRYAVLEIWDQQANYNAWQNDRVTQQFISQTRSLLGSPFDHRLTVLCGATYVDGTGCTPP